MLEIPRATAGSGMPLSGSNRAELLQRVFETVRRSKAGEGVVKWHEPFFIQLQPDKHIHLNFWGSPFEALTEDLVTPMHTHDYGFTSRIVLGAIHNTRAQVAPAVTGEYLRYDIVEADWTRYISFRNSGQRMTVLRVKEEAHSLGVTYDMDPREWHSTRVSEPSISLLDMWDHQPLEYSALSKIGDREQNYTTATRFVDPSRLPAMWKQVDAMVALAESAS